MQKNSRKNKLLSTAIIAVIGSCLAILVVFLINNRGQKIVISSYDEMVSINLGSHKVNNYKKSKIDGANEYVSFDVKSNQEFYNEMKKSEYYKRDLEFDVEGYFAYGFLIKENHFFFYNIKNNNVLIKSVLGSYEDYDNSYYINLPVCTYLNKEVLKSQDENYNFYRGTIDDNINFNMIKKMICYIDSNSYKIENNIFYFKGYSILDGDITYSADYLIKLCEKNGKVLVELYE